MSEITSEKNCLFFFLSAIFGVLCTLNFSILLLIITIIFLLLCYIRLSKLSLTICITILFLFTITSYFSQRNQPIPFNEGEQVEITIIFKNKPTIDGNQLTGLGQDTHSKQIIWLQYKIKNKKEKEILLASTFSKKKFKAKGTLQIPLRPTTENAFDFPKYLKRKNATYILNVEKIQQLQEQTSLQKLWSIREVGLHFLENKFPSPLSSYGQALVFGENKNISTDAYRNYQKIGVVHLFAISGAHVALLVNALYYSLTRIGIQKQHAHIVLLIILPFYAYMTGFSPSASRACGMYMIYSLGKLNKKNITSLQAICYCLFISLLINPTQIFTIGWQLSFTIAIGLSLSSTILKRGKGSIKKSMIITAICQLISMPLMLTHFYEISLAGFIFNTIYVPLFSYIIFPAVLIAYLLTLTGVWGYEFVNIVVNKLLIIVIKFSEKIAKIPFSTLNLGKPSSTMTIILVGIIFILMISWELQRKKATYWSIILLVIWVVGSYNRYYISTRGEIVFLDIGQGDAIFIKLPNNKGNYLIDTGGIISFSNEQWKEKKDPFNTGKNIILPYLKSRGIRKIDRLILTHADQDHIGGAPELISPLNISEIVIPKGQRDSFQKYSWFLEATKNIKVSEVGHGDNWNVEESSFYVINPLLESTTQEDKNHNSIVIMAKIDNKNWLFTGDLDEEGENKILTKLQSKLKIDVLKVGHHGSKSSTSEQFLNALQPKTAIISVGRNNRYGHPHEDVLVRLKNNDTKIYRTDQLGSIHYKFKRGRLGVWTSYPP